ncbi:molybdopterin molybdenumtransferase MoeA [Rhodobacteraceae bacterium CCMM004]|nr:molybdopterin molybdenumtransferase MoeA [Rhodobacteraceae bacterium CCMM004]
MTVLPPLTPHLGCGCDTADPAVPLLDLDAALGRIARHAAPVAGSESLPLPQAVGRVLAAPVRAAAASPPFDSAAMDGYAVATAGLAGEGPWILPVGPRVPAGMAAPGGVAPDRAARIFTGAPVPAGADAVIAQEDVTPCGAAVTVARRPRPGSHIRRAGEDMARGQPVVAAGTRLGPRHIAACAAAGAGRVEVRRRLRVAVVVTGDEVRQAGAGRGAAQIWDVNTPMLCAALAGPRIDLVHVGQAADSVAAVRQAVGAWIGRADLVVTTGGVSVGEEDHVRPALRALGAEIAVHGVAIKPGKPLSYGTLGDAHWLGLPGNPLAAVVTWQVFGTALVDRLTGARASPEAARLAVAADVVHRNARRVELRPATRIGRDALGRAVVTFAPATHSGRVGGLPMSDGLIRLPPGRDPLPAGSLVAFLPFSEP